MAGVAAATAVGLGIAGYISNSKNEEESNENTGQEKEIVDNRKKEKNTNDVTDTNPSVEKKDEKKNKSMKEKIESFFGHGPV